MSKAFFFFFDIGGFHFSTKIEIDKFHLGYRHKQCCIFSSLMIDWNLLQATLNEVKVLSMLKHPNIIEYYDSFFHEQAMMIVMEYASGGTLFDLIGTWLSLWKFFLVFQSFA